MKGVISGLKNTVGGTVDASARALNAVEPIQYSGIMLTTSIISASPIAARLSQCEERDWTTATNYRALRRLRYLTYTLVIASTASSIK